VPKKTVAPCEPRAHKKEDCKCEDSSKPNHVTHKVDKFFDVRSRLDDLIKWEQEWELEDKRLLEIARELDDSNLADVSKGLQITNLRKRKRIGVIRKPLELDQALIREIGFFRLRENLVTQFTSLKPAEKKTWMNNFYFLMTPDLQELNKKFSNVRDFRALGQDRNFLLSGHSGMGKTAYLNWLASNYIPIVRDTYNEVILVKVDAPVNNASAKPLYQRILLECGCQDFYQDTEEILLYKIISNFAKCGVEVVVVDEVEHIRTASLKRRLLEISNVTVGVGFICASVNARKWTVGDDEIKGRWNDGFRLKRYTGDRLRALLTIIELFLPFSQSSNLNKHEIRIGNQKSDVVSGPAKLIEEYTGGILRDIMILILDSAIKSIDENQPCISPTMLENSWNEIRTDSDKEYMKKIQKSKEKEF